MDKLKYDVQLKESLLLKIKQTSPINVTFKRN